MLRGMLIIEGNPDDMVKEFDQLVRTGLMELAENWHRKIMPHHFTEQAQRKYNYAGRTIEYLRQKAKKHPMAGPLEFSGQSRRELTRSMLVRVARENKTKEIVVRGKMKAPRYFWMTPANHPDKPEELLAVTGDEVNAMATRLNERVTGQLKIVRERKIYS